MTLSQRFVLIVGLLLTAGVLHFTLCRWTFGGTGGSRDTIIGTSSPAQYQYQATSRNGPVSGSYTGYARYGLTSRYIDDHKMAIPFGIGVPLILVMFASYFIAGWKQSSRRNRGACIKCGYELQFDYSSRCSECGWK